MRRLDPRVSVMNGRKTGNVLGREPIGRPWGAVKARRIYGGGHGAASVHEKENDEAHQLEEKREGGV